MRWVRFSWQGRPSLGEWDGQIIRDFTQGAAQLSRGTGDLGDEARQALEAGDLLQWINAVSGHGPAEMQAVAAALEEVRAAAPTRPVDEVKILPPIPKPPKNIMCIGRNYKDHAIEAARFRGQAVELPEHPIIFTKPHTAITGHDDDIRLDPGVTQQLDYEGEVAVIIGRQGRDIPPENALDYVFGYTLMNDVTARDLQGRHKQYFKGKGLDTFAPLGPVVVEQRAIGDPSVLQLETRVNGELRQRASLAQLIFSIPVLISIISAGMTLEPGDIIATGTPEGVGIGFQPPRFLQDGDVIEISVDPIGTLRNRVRAVIAGV